MIKTCEECWNTYDTEREGASIYFCPKCNMRGFKFDGMEETEGY